MCAGKPALRSMSYHIMGQEPQDMTRKKANLTLIARILFHSQHGWSNFGPSNVLQRIVLHLVDVRNQVTQPRTIFVINPLLLKDVQDLNCDPCFAETASGTAKGPTFQNQRNGSTHLESPDTCSHRLTHEPRLASLNELIVLADLGILGNLENQLPWFSTHQVRRWCDATYHPSTTVRDSPLSARSRSSHQIAPRINEIATPTSNLSWLKLCTHSFENTKLDSNCLSEICWCLWRLSISVVFRPPTLDFTVNHPHHTIP